MAAMNTVDTASFQVGPTALEAGIRKWIIEWNADPRPFVWTKTADEILDTLAAYCRRISDQGTVSA
jgi:hypothetical protein